MLVPNNILEQVVTYQESSLALLVNQNPWIATANKKFQNFDTFQGNLGDTVSFDLPPRFVTNQTLIANFQASEQRVQNLTVDQAENVSYAFSAQQFIFNVDEYMDKFGRAAIAELGASIGSNIALNAVNHTYRAFGDGVTPINSFQQYAQALANYRNYGAPNAKAKVYIDDVTVPGVVGSGLNQFATNRNNEIANSWMLGDFSNAEFMSTNLLPVHIAGTVGNDSEVLTVDAIDPTGTILTLSGATPSTATLVEGDILTIKTNLATTNDLFFLQFIGHKQSAQEVQVRVTADTIADGGGIITATVFPALIDDPTDANSNVNKTVVGADNVTALPSHRAGLICAGDPLFLAMPMLPEEVPFPTANLNDPDTGASMRMYYGSVFGQNERGFVNDCIWGSTLVDEYAMRVVYPL
jgi:hypothetical protein